MNRVHWRAFLMRLVILFLFVLAIGLSSLAATAASDWIIHLVRTLVQQ